MVGIGPQRHVRHQSISWAQRANARGTKFSAASPRLLKAYFGAPPGVRILAGLGHSEVWRLGCGAGPMKLLLSNGDTQAC